MEQDAQKAKTDSIREYGKKLSVPTIVYGGIIILALLLISFVCLAYFWKGSTGTMIGGVLSRALPLPAAFVNYTSIVTMQELQNDLAALKIFYENQDFSSVGMRVDFSTSDGKKRLQIVEKQLLNKLIEDKAILILAKKQGISLTSEDADKELREKLDKYGVKEDAEKDLQKRYGWTLDDFKEKVVMPSMYQEALGEKISGELETAANNSKEKILKAQKELQSGKDFAEVARQYSEGSSSAEGGELGWMRKEQLLPEVAEKVFDSQVKKNEIVQSRLGFHILDVEDKKKEGEQDVVRLRQVFVKSKTFGDWLSDKMKNMDIYVPMRGLYWSNGAVGVQFSDESMEGFEKDARDNFDGDASLFF